jgi:hypothetical protein
MHTLFAFAFLTLCAAFVGNASAADIRVGAAAIVAPSYAGAVRAGQYFIYDDQPGVYVRSYWREPWRNRHYFPFTGKKPKVGRHENLSAKRPAPKPAESFYREWSTLSLYPPHVVTPPPDNTQPLVLIESAPIAAPAPARLK